MLTLTNQEHLRIYVDTLQALARDAHYQGKAETCAWIRGYLFGLVPDQEREGFDAQLSAAPVTELNYPTPKPEPEPIPEPEEVWRIEQPLTGQTVKQVPVSKPAQEAQGSRLLLQQSDTLKW